MHQTTVVKKRIAFAFAALGLTAVFALAAVQPVSARRGADDQVAQNTTAEQETESETENETQHREEVKSRVAELKDKAKEDVEKKKENRKVLAEDKRKLVCENKQAAIENKLAAFNQAADKHMSKLNDVYTRIEAYQKAENIQPSNWTDLLTAATEKQGAAQTAVDSLKEVAVDVDCNDPETVVKLSAVRDAAKVTRTALHDYRMALKNMVVALAQAKDSEDTGDTTADTTNSDTTGADSSANDTTGDTNTGTTPETSEGGN